MYFGDLLSQIIQAQMVKELIGDQKVKLFVLLFQLSMPILVEQRNELNV